MKTQKTIIYKMLVGALVVIGIITMESHSIYASNPDCTEVNITAPEQIVKGQAFDIIVTYFFDQDISAEEKREYLRSAINISSTPNTESVGNHTGRWNDDNYVFSATDIVPLDSTASNYVLRAEFNGVLKDSITIPIVDSEPTPPSPTPTPRTRPRDDDDDSPKAQSEPSWTPAKAAATIAAEKAAKQQAAETQQAAVQTFLRTLATTKPTDGVGEARKVIVLDMTKVDILDTATVNLLTLNSKFEYYIKISDVGGLTNTVKIPANFNYRPFIKADGTMNIHEVLWSIVKSRIKKATPKGSLYMIR